MNPAIAPAGPRTYPVPMLKRIFDVGLTVLTAPLWLAVVGAGAAVLTIELRGNPFFVQERIGLHGKPFRMFKLRTMRHAEAGQEDHYEVQDFSSFVFAPPDKPNPRITRFGAIARKTSIDELPNLINVLRGEMSLVGPRPEIPEIVAQFPAAYHRRHDVLPGIAGLAQVSGRSDLTYEETATYDLDYVEHHSLRRDIHILLLTAFSVLRGSGAR